MNTKQYLAYQAFGSVFVNSAIGLGFAWPLRHEAHIDSWGYPSMASDTLISGFLLSVLTIVIGSLFVRLDVRLGRVEPLVQTKPWASAPIGVWKRAAIFGPIFAIPSVLIALAVLGAMGQPHLTFGAFLLFKVVFTAVLGMVVTPFNAHAVLAGYGSQP
ncbi:MAG TPA: hypothetical protein VK540_24275 [Polyangiaceae bacterium]|nr:hypothetical protein [Polyangiaceae bacterium]